MKRDSGSRWGGARVSPVEILKDGNFKEKVDSEGKASPTSSSDKSEISPSPGSRVVSSYGSETSPNSLAHVRRSGMAPVTEREGLKFPSTAWGSASDADDGVRNTISNLHVQTEEVGRNTRPNGRGSVLTRSFPQNKTSTAAEALHEQGEDDDDAAALRLLSSLRNWKENDVVSKEVAWLSKGHKPLRLPKPAGEDDHDNEDNNCNDSSKTSASHEACLDSGQVEIVDHSPAGLTRRENVPTLEIEECDSFPRIGSPPLKPKYLEDSDGVPVLRTSSELQKLEAEIELCTEDTSALDGEVSKETESVVETPVGSIKSGKNDINEETPNQQLLEMQRRLESLSLRLHKVQDHLADVQNLSSDVRRMNCRCYYCRSYCYLQKGCSRLREILPQLRNRCSRHPKKNRKDLSERRRSSFVKVKLSGGVVSVGARSGVKQQAGLWSCVVPFAFK